MSCYGRRVIRNVVMVKLKPNQDPTEVAEVQEVFRKLNCPGTVSYTIGSDLGAVVLAITGGEALYADMGHFGRRPIKWAWLLYVFPCLFLNYLGQGALILDNPAAVKNPFFMLVPDALLYLGSLGPWAPEARAFWRAWVPTP